MGKTKIKFTYEDYLHLSSDKRYELLEGELFMVPSPSYYHQKVLRELFRFLDSYVRGKELGEVCLSPLDVVLSNENLLQPDIFFISKENMSIIKEDSIRGAPDLVIEILSPSSGYREREVKKKIYAKYGVKEYWLVDTKKKRVEVFALPENLNKPIIFEKEISTTPLFSGLNIDLRSVFA